MKVFDSATGLTLKSNNGHVVQQWSKNRERFKDISEVSTGPPLVDMSVEQLKAYAAEHDIDTGRTRSAEKIIAIIKAAQN